MERGKSVLDGPHWFDTYECKDSRFISIGSLEPQFYALLLEKLDLTDDLDFKDQMNVNKWPEQKAKLDTLFKTQTQKYWCDLMEGTDVCFAPVLNPADSASHPHMKVRGVYLEKDGDLQAAAAPRFSSKSSREPPKNAVNTTIDRIIADWNA